MHRRQIEKLYEDSMNVLRVVYVETKGISRPTEVNVAKTIQCGLSYGGGDKSAQSSNAHTIDYDVTVFAAPDVDVQPGDRLEVIRCGRILNFEVIGMPSVYPSHQEIKAKGRDLA